MFACPECEIPFAGGHCECRREWTETGGVPDLYVAAQERGELPGISTALRGFYEESPGAPWRQEDDARALAWTWDADPLIGRLHADLSPRARVLDLGCGSGGAACFLGLLGREVIGVDLAMTGLLRAEAFRSHSALEACLLSASPPRSGCLPSRPTTTLRCLAAYTDGCTTQGSESIAPTRVALFRRCPSCGGSGWAAARRPSR